MSWKLRYETESRSRGQDEAKDDSAADHATTNLASFAADLAPSDALYASQWHLAKIGRLGFGSDGTAGLERVWNTVTGAGVAVGIWDSGVQRGHWDLDARYAASRHVSVDGSLNDGQPLTSGDGHGTAVAGLIAAENNGQGGVGVAWGAEITGVRIFGGADDINTHWSRYLKTLDSLRNFDVTNHSYGAFPGFYAPSGDLARFGDAAALGRGGLGTVNVKSAGNDNVDGNGDPLDASRFTVTVAAIDSGAAGNAAWYSTYGAHVLVAAPAGSVTTDMLGAVDGYNGLLGGDYTNVFGGTSAAGPITAGVVALMLDAAPGLGWRDVQDILAYSSVGTGSVYGGAATNENFAWKWNGADDWNGGGLHYSEDYGYGMVNAFNAVRMAEAWSLFQPVAATSANEASVVTGTLQAARAIADASTLNYAFNVAGDIVLEHVDLSVSLAHSDFTDLRIRLVSPDGTVMSLYDGSTGSPSLADFGLAYTFGVDGLRGESSLGTWTLQIQDAVPLDSGTLNTLAFTGYGSAPTAADVYHYTDEVLTVLARPGQADRLALADTDGGSDWIDAAAMVRDLVLDLRAGAISTLAGSAFLALAAGTLIENAVAGDGDDTLYGNEADNLLYGMIGNDQLAGGEGVDTAAFRGLRSAYTISAADGVTTVLGPDGSDTLTGFEWLLFDDATLADPSAGTPAADTRAPGLVSSAPADGATAVAAGASIVLGFDEAVRAGTGSIAILQDGALWRSIDVADATQVSFSGGTVTVNPAVDFAKDAGYAVLIDAGAIVDLAGNAYAGLQDPAALDFRTEPVYVTRTGTSASERIDGDAADELLLGLAGNDTLYGGAGNDTLIGGAGNDAISGGAGIDTISFEGTGTSVKFSLASTATQRTSGAGTDRLLALDVENLVGGAAADTLTGNSGANRIDGGSGNDVLNGMLGMDTLAGGAGKDYYAFTTALGAGNVDTIVGFNPLDDTLRLENAVFTKLTKTGTLNSAYFRANDGGTAMDSNDYVLYDTATGSLAYDADGSGGADPPGVFGMLVEPAGIPTFADFAVI